MSMSVLTALSASSKRKSALPLLSGIVVLLALVLSAGLGKTSAVVKTKSAVSLLAMGDVESCGALNRIGVVLCTGNPLPKPGAQLTAVGVCSMALGDTTGAGADLQLSGCW